MRADVNQVAAEGGWDGRDGRDKDGRVGVGLPGGPPRWPRPAQA